MRAQMQFSHFHDFFSLFLQNLVMMRLSDAKGLGLKLKRQNPERKILYSYNCHFELTLTNAWKFMQMCC